MDRSRDRVVSSRAGWRARLSSALGVAAFAALTGRAIAQTPPPPPAPDDSAAVKEEARTRFELGLSHFDSEDWAAALVEFLRSRELFATKNNTKNAALCLRKVGRYDEALTMFEALVRDFPELSEGERALAAHEMAELQASVGTVSIVEAPPGAAVTVDGVDRGKAPLAGALRLSAGTHVVRVSLEGTLPFQARVDLSGRQALVLRAPLAVLMQAGRLRVTATGSEPLEILVDGARVGSTPWEGALAPGPHTLSSRGGGRLGTAPQRVVVVADQVAAVALAPSELRAALRVEASPAEASIDVDGVPVGRSAWDGPLASGPHRVTVRLEGYASLDQSVVLTDGPPQVVRAELRVRSTPRGTVAFEVDGDVPLGIVWGGDLGGQCTSGCSAALPVGGEGLLRAVYETTSGVGVGGHVGYLLLHDAYDGRPETFADFGLPASHGHANDTLWLQGLRLGADVQYLVRGGAWPVRLRLGAGAFVATLKDDRSATGFVDAQGGRFAVQTGQKSGADYLFIAPEARIGRRLGPHLEVSAGLELLVLGALKAPSWGANDPQVVAGTGAGTFPSATLAGSVMLFAVPSLGLRYEP